MKKIFLVLLSLIMMLGLSACDQIDELFAGLNPEVFAPDVTSGEAEFIDMVAELKNTVVALSNTIVENNNEVRRASGIIIKKEEGALFHKYYILTSQYVVAGKSSIKVHTTPTENIDGTVLNVKTDYEQDEDIALVWFESSKNFDVYEVSRYSGTVESLNTRFIFSIGTPLSLSYYNYVTNPASIMGYDGNILVHGTNLNFGQVGSPLFLKETGELIGINVSYSLTTGARPEVLINRAIFINRALDLVEELI
ncbi:MAG TPA: serine protease [Acholeplasma sp.]|nr:serine protease [Acholeplasma sp.]